MVNNIITFLWRHHFIQTVNWEVIKEQYILGKSRQIILSSLI